MMVEQGTFLVGTDFPSYYAGYFAGYDDALAQKLYDQRIDRLRRAYQAGVQIAFGADVTDQKDGFTRGSLTISFISSFKDAGISPEDLLRIMTINGAKRFCSGANIADYIYAVVKSDPDAERYQNLSIVLIPPDAPGVTIELQNAMGMKGASTCDVTFEDVEVPAENIVGGEAGWNDG